MQRFKDYSVDVATPLAEGVDEKKVWKDFARITTNRPSKSDIKTLHYKEYKNYVRVDWGNYSHLGAANFKDPYFAAMGIDRVQFMDWLDSQGLTGSRLKVK